MSADPNYEHLKLIDFNKVSFVNEISELNEGFFNAPELNNPDLVLNAEPSQDAYSFLLSLAVLEVGHKSLTDQMGPEIREGFWEKNKFELMKKEIVQRLKKIFKVVEKQEGFMAKVWNFIKRIFGGLFFAQNAIKDCNQFVCLIENGLLFDQFMRPSIVQIKESLKRIKQSFKEESLLIKNTYERSVAANSNKILL